MPIFSTSFVLLLVQGVTIPPTYWRRPIKAIQTSVWCLQSKLPDIQSPESGPKFSANLWSAALSKSVNPLIVSQKSTICILRPSPSIRELIHPPHQKSQKLHVGQEWQDCRIFSKKKAHVNSVVWYLDCSQALYLTMQKNARETMSEVSQLEAGGCQICIKME